MRSRFYIGYHQFSVVSRQISVILILPLRERLSIQVGISQIPCGSSASTTSLLELLPWEANMMDITFNSRNYFVDRQHR